MNNLEIRNVPFLGTELLAAQNEDGDIYAGVSAICNGIGLNKNGKDRQIKNVQHDAVLNKGCVKFDAGVFDPNNSTVALKLEYVPLWLAKISITPKMKSEHPEVAEKLVQYQLKAKDVLAQAFIGRYSNTQYPMPKDYPSALRALADAEEKRLALQAKTEQQAQVIGELKPKADYTDRILKSKGVVPITAIAKDYGMTGNEMNKLLHRFGVQYRMGDMWLLYRCYHGRGYTHSETFDFEHKDGTPDARMTTKWTQKGRLFLYEVLKENGILPMIERTTLDKEQ